MSQCLTQAVDQQGTIGQVGQHIVVSKVLHKHLGRLALGNVTRTTNGTDRLTLSRDKTGLVDIEGNLASANFSRFFKNSWLVTTERMPINIL